MMADGGAELHEQLITLAGVPALVASIEDPSETAGRGTVLLLHGLTGTKEVQRTEAHALAHHGYLAVTLDAVGHGSRRYPDFDERFAADGDRSFFEIVQRTADELPAVIAALAGLGWARPGQLGACGISMGGFILFGAVSAGCAIDVAATIVASPRWRHVPESPHQQLERYFPTPLLMQTGSADLTVSPDGARDLHRELLSRYASVPERLRYLEHEGEGHMFSPPAWHRAWDEVLAWFGRFLRG